MEEVLEYGNLAVKLRRKSKEGYTHEWTVYVRPPPGREFIFVDKVVFNLHETCQRPIDVRTSSPYESKQQGWGEFPLVIDVHFKYGFEKWTCEHTLNLHTVEKQPGAGNKHGTTPVLVSVPLDFTKLSEEHVQQLTDRVRAFMFRLSNNWEREPALWQNVSVKTMQREILTELKLDVLDPARQKELRTTITEIASLQLQNCRDRRDKRGREESSEEKVNGTATRRRSTSTNCGNSKTRAHGGNGHLDALHERILASTDQQLFEIYQIVRERKVPHEYEDTLVFDLGDLDQASLDEVQRIASMSACH